LHYRRAQDALFVLCSGSQYTSNEVAVYDALQNGQSVASLNLVEPSFNTSAGFFDPVTLLTSLAAGPVGDLITSIAGTLAKDGIEQGGATAVAGLLGKQELAADASFQQDLVASGDLPPTGAGAGVLANQAAGNAARDAIAARYPGAETEVTFQTALGARRVDVLTPGGLAIESKVGYSSLTQSVASQIAKDQWLVANGDVTSVKWDFSPSQVTGRAGPSGPLAAALKRAGIPWSILP
jgi:hypothetical protein